MAGTHPGPVPSTPEDDFVPYSQIVAVGYEIGVVSYVSRASLKLICACRGVVASVSSRESCPRSAGFLLSVISIVMRHHCPNYICNVFLRRWHYFYLDEYYWKRPTRLLESSHEHRAIDRSEIYGTHRI